MHLNWRVYSELQLKSNKVIKGLARCRINFKSTFQELTPKSSKDEKESESFVQKARSSFWTSV